jgi:hypothetical protein
MAQATSLPNLAFAILRPQRLPMRSAMSTRPTAAAAAQEKNVPDAIIAAVRPREL